MIATWLNEHGSEQVKIMVAKQARQMQAKRFCKEYKLKFLAMTNSGFVAQSKVKQMAGYKHEHAKRFAGYRYFAQYFCFDGLKGVPYQTNVLRIIQ